MWRRRAIEFFLTLVLALGTTPAPAQMLAGVTHWSGQVRLGDAVTVPANATLTIAAGTTIFVSAAETPIVINGRLLVEGTPAAPVMFDAPAGWRGIQFVKGLPGSYLRYARFARAATAVSTVATDFTVVGSEFHGCKVAIRLEREANPLIEDNWFADNDTGIEIEMKSSPTIRHNRFSGHAKSAIFASHASRGLISDNRFNENQQGITLLQRHDGQVVGNYFSTNDTAIFCNQTRDTPLVERNRFEANRVAVSNVSFSSPNIAENSFIGNDTAIHNDQFGSASIRNNLFRDNRTALYNNRKSCPKVRLNRFEANDLALYCDFSSYPEVKQNNFVGNTMAVKLGIYQSGDWERRFGSKVFMQREATARSSQSPMLARVANVINDTVDVSGNWWGKDTAQLEAAGERGNVAIFYDHADQPEVTYEGYGPGSYRLDRVQFAPWLTKAVPNAGSREKP